MTSVLKNKALPKGLCKKPAIKQSLLKARNLAKLGKLRLAEKIAKVQEQTETPEEAATLLKGVLTGEENSKAHGRHKTWLKSNPEEEKQYEALDKRGKGLAAVLWLVKQDCPKFCTLSSTVQQDSKLKAKEKWQSELQMLQQFSPEEFELHLSSGRITWRCDPWTPNVFNYRDLGDLTKVTEVAQKKQWKWGQEFAQEEDDTDWSSFVGKDLHSQLLDCQGKGKGKTGKGKTKALTKGGKGKGVKPSLALTNGEVEPPQQEEEEEEKDPAQAWSKCLAKVKAARNKLSSCYSDLDQAIKAACLAKRLTKKGKEEAQEALLECKRLEEECKLLMLKRERMMDLKQAKGLLVEAVKACKNARDEGKELEMMAKKTASKTSKSK